MMVAGYLYVGRPKRFLLLVSICLFNVLVILFVSIPNGMPPQLWFFILAAPFVLATLFGAVDCIRLAVQQPNYSLRRFNRWWVYLLVWICFTTSVAALQAYKRLAPVGLIANQSFFIPSTSMHPVLKRGDYVFSTSCGFECLDVKRGDIVLFKLPTDGHTDYVKRVIGLPGDTVQMIEGHVFLNGQPLKQTRLTDYKFIDYQGRPRGIPQYEETLPNGRSYPVLDLDRGSLDNTGVYEVLAGHYFMLGDNRDNSRDSRVMSSVGYVPAKNIFAKPLLVYWSEDLSRIGMTLND